MNSKISELGARLDERDIPLAVDVIAGQYSRGLWTGAAVGVAAGFFSSGAFLFLDPPADPAKAAGVGLALAFAFAPLAGGAFVLARWLMSRLGD